jgi:toxin-antitoxin system PIN domain toxin
VTLVDTNLLIYATFEDAPEHARARGWIEERLRDDAAPVVLCWPVVYAFVRLITSPRVFAGNAVSLQQGWATAEAYLTQSNVVVVSHGPKHERIAAELAATPGLRSEDVPDVELAALAIEHGLVVASHDAGFRRFAGLRTFDPLA